MTEDTERTGLKIFNHEEHEEHEELENETT